MYRLSVLLCLVVVFLALCEGRRDGRKMVNKKGKGKKHLEKTDFQRGRTVPSRPDEEAFSLMENKELFEGDIKGIDKDSADIVAKKFNAHRHKVWAKHGKVWGKAKKAKGRGRGNNRNRRGSPSFATLWPTGTVPYTLSSQYTADARATIARAIADFGTCTCITFVPRTTETNYIHLEPQQGCWSYIGMIGGKQIISLAEGCLYHGIIQHEIIHALGFFHEQSRTDRDTYVTINFGNIQSGYESNFNKYDDQESLGTDYDYGSVMHYGSTAFTVNGQATIVSKQSGVTIGQRDVFSQIDLTDINRLYECPTAATAGCAAGGCADLYSNCASYVAYCKTWQAVTDGCKNTCGTC